MILKMPKRLTKVRKPEELGVKAIDDHTLQLTLNQELPYYKELLTFGTFMPLNEKFVKSKAVSMERLLIRRYIVDRL